MNFRRPFSTLLHFFRDRIPGQLIIQMTDRCNARCPQCGMRVTQDFPRTALSVEEIKPMIDSAAEKGVQSLSFTGGEPLLLLPELTHLIQYAGNAGIPFIRTGTNGFFFRNPEHPDFLSRVAKVADALAGTPLRNFWISIDSSIPEIHEEMRGFPGIIRGMEKALPLFHERGLYPSANLGINRNLGGTLTNGFRRAQFESNEAYLSEFHGRYLEAFDAYYRFIISLGFTIANACYPMSISDADRDWGLSPVYAATAEASIVAFADAEKSLLFKALGTAVRRHRAGIRIFSPLTALRALEERYAGMGRKETPCRGGIDFFFIDAKNGDTFPCGYRGEENLGKFQDLDLGKRPSPSCNACDWECFRDPSELLSPILGGVRRPLSEVRKFFKDPGRHRLWLEDIRYYRACGFFTGRAPLQPERLLSFVRE